MNYRFHEIDPDLKTSVCKLNGISLDELNVSDFRPDYGMKILEDMKEKLLSFRDKRFFIVGDYDCDGICATAIMRRLFDDLHIAVNHYIPSRTREGYGLNEKIVRTAYDNGFGVLLCVDNGINAKNELQLASELGMKTVVIDHHEYASFPEVDLLLHPDLFEKGYADMCAAGLCALVSGSFRYDPLSQAYGGLATLADMVSVFGYNRYLLKDALSILNEKTVYPIHYLLKKKDCDFVDLSYDVIPKINAVSRLDDMLNVNYVVRYLLDDSPSCMSYLNKIEEINTLRKDLSRQMSLMARRLADERNDVIVVSSPAFKEGLCGLVANRLMNEYGKPVIIFSENGDLLKGSGRAPKGLDLYSCLVEIEDLFVTFGGHAQAVGLSIEKNDLPKLIDHLKGIQSDQDDSVRDVLLLNRDLVDIGILEEMKQLQPFGTGFEEPLFALDCDRDMKKIVVAGQYPKFLINDRIDAISFNPRFLDRENGRMIGHLKKDDYHSGKLSFIIEDLIQF